MYFDGTVGIYEAVVNLVVDDEMNTCNSDVIMHTCSCMYMCAHTQHIQHAHTTHTTHTMIIL